MDYPVFCDEYNKEFAPFVYTEKGEERARLLAMSNPKIEPRTAGTIACFAGKVLQGGRIAQAWLEKGYITRRV